MIFCIFSLSDRQPWSDVCHPLEEVSQRSACVYSRSFGDVRKRLVVYFDVVFIAMNE